MIGFKANQPHNDLPGLPPAADLETKAVLKTCILARAAVAELRQACNAIPNPAVLIDTLPLLEAQASSAIENIVTTADRLFQHSGDEESADPATKETLRYRQALYTGFHSLTERPLSTSTAIAICSSIKGQAMEVRRVPGTVLKDSAGAVVYTPPVGETRLLDLLSNWERFIHAESDLDPLIKMAVAHYQFEAIHPFTDGNGRTGRILNILMILEAGLLDLPVLFLSRHIIKKRENYYTRLQAVTTHGAWEDWILYILDAVQQTASWTASKIIAIRKQMLLALEHTQKHAPDISSRELVDLIFRLPYCRIGDVMDAGLAKRQTASRYLHRLEELGILQSVKIGREKLFLHLALMHLLTDDDAAPRPYQVISA